jgi:outer membrane protein
MVFGSALAAEARVPFRSRFPILWPMILARVLPRVVPAAWLLLSSTGLSSPALPAQDEPDGPAMELTLDQAVQVAVGNNLEVKLAEAQADVSQATQLGSWGAFDWVFDASLGYTDSDREVGSFLDGGSGSVNSKQTDYNFSFLRPLETGGSFTTRFVRGVSLTDSNFQQDPEQTTDTLSVIYTQPLLRGAWSEYATSVQRENEVLWRRQIEVARETRQRVARQVSDAYWDLVRDNELLEVAYSGVELGRSREDRNQRQLDAGIGTEVDVVQAQAELATRHETLIRARNDVETRQDDLRKLLFAGKEKALWEVRLVPTTGLPAVISTADVPDWTAAVTIAIDHRTELRQRRLDLTTNRLRLQRASSERLSGLDLQLSINSRAVDPKQGTAFNDSISGKFPTYAATLTYNMPLGNRTARYAERAQRARVRTAQLNYDKVELDVVAEVRAAVREILFAAEQVTATVESLRLARRRLESEEALQRNDLSTTFQVLEFQQALIEAMSNELTARANFAKAQVALRNAQGLLGE